ncbi:ABC transporter substrate-binding protein [Massilia sp. PAMC28688]|uniref:ABC transporter substrate-binding protein n=1 Tax=Massilia sp. PAMC28688 TaxID=2861283 RepID=UPI001C6345BF|nr:ABC transporter substrate-binding protein [Massilia sp. PAMC28688]QYF92587.1 ABC transporter substrate-binding protein [Massilia sp. PAMC28688]
MTRRLLRACTLVAVTALGALPAAAATLTMACDSIGHGSQVCADGVRAWERKTGHKVKMLSLPASSSERLVLYRQLLAAESPLLDVMTIDIVWPGILADSLVDLRAAAAPTIGQHFPAIVRNNTVNGRLIAMPWFLDTGLLYYRKDLLEKYKQPVPATWDALAATARLIQKGERKNGQALMWGYAWQGSTYEGLTCNGLEWILSHGGGTIVAPGGAVTVDNPATIAALRMARSWIGDISPPAVLGAREEESRAMFQSGQAVFLRNWPYVWSVVNEPDSPVRGKVGIAVLPRGPGGEAGTTLGGHQLAVSKFSRHPALAIDLVLFLTGKDEQKRRAILLGRNPTIGALYRDPQLLAVNPYQEILRAAAAGATPRPSTVTGRKYEQVSDEVARTVHGVLADGKDPAFSVKALAATLDTMHTGGRW